MLFWHLLGRENAHIRSSMLRYVSLHEVRNFSNYTTFWVADTTDYFNGNNENYGITI